MQSPFGHPRDSEVTSIALLLQKRQQHILTFVFADFIDYENN